MGVPAQSWTQPRRLLPAVGATLAVAATVLLLAGVLNNLTALLLTGLALLLTGLAGWLVERSRSAQEGNRLRLLESAVVHARDAIIILEAEPNNGPGRSVLYVNEAFTRMTGYQAEEVVGRSLHFLRGPRSDAATLDQLREALSQGTSLQVELLNYRKDGSEFWVELSLVPVPAAAGGCAYWVMIQRDVSDRKRAEEELRDREQRLRVLGDNLPDGAVYQLVAEPGDGPARFTYVSAGMERVSGVDADTVLDHPAGAKALTHPADLPRVQEAEELSARNLTPLDCEFRLIAPGGEVKWVHTRAMPQRLPSGGTLWNGVVLDVTARKQTEESLRRSEELFRGLFENASAGVSVTDAHGRFVSANPAFANMLGRPVADIIGRFPAEFTHPDDWTEQQPLLREVYAGSRDGYHIRKRYVRPDGETVWSELSVAIVRGPGGEVRYGIGVSVDVTERRRLEEQLLHAQRMEAVGQLAGGIAHDFNNLLTGVIGNLSRVELPEGDPNREVIAAAERAAVRAADLTRKLLGFARKNQLLTAPVRVEEFVCEVVDILRRTFDPRIEIVTELAPLDPVPADPTLLNQALLNLCLNARDAMPHGGVLLIRAEEVHLTEEEAARCPEARPGAFVRLMVSDTGIGMEPEIQARIFEPFFTTKPVGQGTGLGLPMVHGILKQHSGWVECHTVPGRGTRFDLYLPRAATPAMLSAVRPSEPLTPPPMTTPSLPDSAGAILIVDDEEMIRDLARAVLTAAGHTVLEARDGMEALEIYRQESTRIDLIILDLTMPRLSGRDTFRALQEIDPEVRVLFSSGYSTDDLSDVTGALGLLAKPYRPQELLATVQQAVLAEPATAG